MARLAAFLEQASAPAIVVGAGADDPDTWEALVALAERLGCAVWQESFSGRAGFPQTHRLFAGHLPADRTRLRQTLAPYDAVLAVGAPTFRQYAYVSGPFVEAGTRVAMVSQHVAEVHRSTADLAMLADPCAMCLALAQVVPVRAATSTAHQAVPAPPAPPAPGEQLRAGHVLAALAERLPSNAIVIEESPSSRPELIIRMPARESLGYLSPAMGGLGFALPAATGLRLAQTERPVVAIVGDGGSLYSIQALWSAGAYGAGALFVILKNGGYAVMDRLAEHQRRQAALAELRRRRGRPVNGVRLSGAKDHRAQRARLGSRRGGARPRGSQRTAPPRDHGCGRRELRSLTTANRSAGEEPHRVGSQHLVDLGLCHAGREEQRQDVPGDMEVADICVGEVRVADHEVVEAGGVMPQMDL